MSIDIVVHVVLGAFFLFHGVNHFIHLQELAHHAEHHKWTFETKNMIRLSGIVLIF